METGREDLVSPVVEVPVVEGALVTAIRELRSRGWGSKRIARELSVARNTVRRYVRGPTPGVQRRPAARGLSESQRHETQVLFQGVRRGNEPTQRMACQLLLFAAGAVADRSVEPCLSRGVAASTGRLARRLFRPCLSIRRLIEL